MHCLENVNDTFISGQGLQTLFFESRISCCTTVGGLDLCNVIASGYGTFLQINKCFVYTVTFH